MQLLPIAEILVKMRIRQTLEAKDLQLLQDSILESGLLQPIVVTKQKELTCGFRRLQVLKNLLEQKKQIMFNGTLVPLGMVPTVRLSFENEEAQLAAELNENERRSAFTWQERAQGLARLQELRSQEQGRNVTAMEVAREVGMQGNKSTLSTSVSNAILLAKYMDLPEVQTASTQGQALRRLQALQAVQAWDGQTQQSYDYQCGDGMLYMLGTKEKFDCILTDPPYGISADSIGNVSGQHTYQDAPGTLDFESFFKLTYRVGQEQASLFMFHHITRFNEMKELAGQAGWKVFNTPLLWFYNANNVGQVPWPHHGFRRNYEAILFAIKGKKPIRQIVTDVFTVPNGNLQDVHAAQKPLRLLEQLLQSSCLPGEKVLDPFAGSGSTLVAAKNCKLHATGFELVESNWKLGQMWQETQHA